MGTRVVTRRTYLVLKTLMRTVKALRMLNMDASKTRH